MPTIEQITEGKVDYRIELRGGIVSIGRSPDNAIVLSNPGVARKHAQIVAEAGRWFLEDLNSRNGTFHNGLKVVGRSELSDGDSIGICDIRMVFWDSSRLSAPKEVSYITETERRTIETRTDPRADEDRIALERMTEKVEELNHQIDHMSRELNLAAEFLQALLHRKAPDYPGYRIECHHRFALQVGGDAYDFIAMPDGRLVACIADACGKGLRAALIATQLMAEAKHVMAATNDLAAAVGELNRFIASWLSEVFVSFLAVGLDRSSNKVTIVNGGMCIPALYRRRSGRATILETTKVGFPLGILPEMTYEAETIDVQEGDALVLYSDGVTDSRSRSGRIFGSQGIISALESVGRESPSAYLERLVRTVQDHEQDETIGDDRTLVIIERLEDPATSPVSRWREASSKIRAVRDHRRAVWGTWNSVELGRYLSGTAEAETIRRIEEEASRNAELSAILEVLKGVIEEDH